MDTSPEIASEIIQLNYLKTSPKIKLAIDDTKFLFAQYTKHNSFENWVGLSTQRRPAVTSIAEAICEFDMSIKWYKRIGNLSSVRASYWIQSRV